MVSSDHGSYVPPSLVYARPGGADLARRVRDLEDTVRSMEIQLRVALNRLEILERDRARRV